MKPIKELLQVMLDNQNLFHRGLCDWTMRLYHFDKITADEHLFLHRYIKSNKPSIFSSIDCFLEKMRGSLFYWKPGDIKPRIKWIKKHIKS